MHLGGAEARPSGALDREPRAESFMADNQARDHITHAELALDARGSFPCAACADHRGNLGAYVSTFGAERSRARSIPALLAGVLPHARDLRGGDRRLHQHDADRCLSRRRAARSLLRAGTAWPTAPPPALGLDRAEIRRRNLIPPAAMPYKTPIGPTYDCGDFPKIFARVLGRSDYAGFAKRRAEAARKRGKLRGIGMACYVESSGVAPSRFAGMLGARVGFYESASIRIGAGRRGARRARHPQSRPGPCHHLRADHCVAARRAGRKRSRSSRATPAKCRRAPAPSARARSRSAARRSTAPPTRSSPRAKLIAAHLLEAAPGDIDFADGMFTVAGTDRQHRFRGRRAGRLRRPQPPARNIEPGLQDTAVYDPPNFAFSNGAHVCEIEIDPDTGRIELDRLLGGRRHRHRHQSDDRRRADPRRHRARDRSGDAGALSPMTTAASSCRGSFMDYAIARADDLPVVRYGVRRKPALHAQSARRQGLRRGRIDRLARRAGGRGARCARPSRRHRSRNAADARAGVAGDQRARREQAAPPWSSPTAPSYSKLLRFGALAIVGAKPSRAHERGRQQMPDRRSFQPPQVPDHIRRRARDRRQRRAGGASRHPRAGCRREARRAASGERRAVLFRASRAGSAPRSRSTRSMPPAASRRSMAPRSSRCSATRSRRPRAAPPRSRR